LFDAKTLSLNDSLRQQLRKPLGILVAGSSDICNEYLRSKITGEKPSRLILVGDTVSRNALQVGLQPDVIVIDNKEMRRNSSSAIPLDDRKQFSLFNAQGSINADSWRLIDQAVKIGNSAVIVNGEEDLLSLVAISVAPIGALVVYGQPNEGIVLVNVTLETKREVMRILELMEATSV
jgi:hypothetical protein